ncbi:GCN5 family N-acetyltransferase [Oxalicibacterium flavum]|uniref:GCN5 family N-acetyltransferase n=1 Tax=Oxalicibacterium flavum TaxID=179467 RepID=A0A8J2UL69_9BURK|nr:GNAT family protein [Oxalicibacterium flavum]GGB99720.1 GCN5 family N-acetyltransferase [Oxalicibacterium flavum]
MRPRIEIRPLRESDTASLIRLNQRLDVETKLMLYEPEERDTDVASQRNNIRALLARDNSTVILALSDGEAIGFLGAIGGRLKRNRHCAQLAIGVLQAHAGQGIGTRLFAELEEWRVVAGISRLELTVMAHNDRAIRLYEKVGFVREGIRRRSLKVDDRYVDEIHMAKCFA